MPKGIKSAPPQQSSLQEMWSGTKKAKPAKVADAPAIVVDASAADIQIKADEEDENAEIEPGKRVLRLAGTPD